VAEIKLYVDEDAMHKDFVVSLRSRQIQMITVSEAGLVNRSDAEQLEFSTQSGCVLYTFNISDFYELH
jgi:predicted nuclease of predicted toxin-antitoxin system